MRTGQLNVLSCTAGSTGCGARSVHRLNVTSGTAVKTDCGGAAYPSPLRTLVGRSASAGEEVVEEPVHLHDEGDMALVLVEVGAGTGDVLR